MSTRAQICIRDEFDEVWFYRHQDGYPETALRSLRKFLQWVKDGKIRSNTGQASGWLVLLGASEYTLVGDRHKSLREFFEPSDDGFSGWKVGAYEPCSPERHGDIEWFYTIDLVWKQIEIEHLSEDTTKWIDDGREDLSVYGEVDT